MVFYQALKCTIFLSKDFELGDPKSWRDVSSFHEVQNFILDQKTHPLRYDSSRLSE